MRPRVNSGHYPEKAFIAGWRSSVIWGITGDRHGVGSFVKMFALTGVLVVQILHRELLLNGEQRVAGVAVPGDLDCLVID